MSDPQVDRTPYCHKIRYGITGAPILTEDEMDGSHAPGVGVSPKLIELVYSPARDGKPARVDASVTGDWTRFGEPDGFGGQVTTHFKGGPDGWPAWLAEEARLHDPERAAAAPTVWIDGHPQLEAIAAAVWESCRTEDTSTVVDDPRNIAAAALAALLAVLPPPADRAAILREAEAKAREVVARLWDGGTTQTALDRAGGARAVEFEIGQLAAQAELRRLADEAQQPERLRCPHCQMPHDLTPSGELACASIRASIADQAAVVSAVPPQPEETA